MSDTLPAFEPLMLRGLTYDQIVLQMKLTGCAGRRNHWCAPVIRWEGGRIIFDNDGELHPWTLAEDDRGASDWQMTEDPAQ